MNTVQYELLDNAPERVEETAELFRWSENYNYPSPGSLFLDLIGYSDMEFGTPMFDLNECPSKLGYLELGMLSDALKEYAENPQFVYAWVEELMNAGNTED